MADRDITVIVPATSQDLLSLPECKTFLNIALADTSRDAQLALQISTASAVLADMANRKPDLGFGKTRVQEDWREVMNGRLQVMHWPIILPPASNPDTIDGPVILTANGNTIDAVTGFRVETSSGKISTLGGWWNEPVSITYSGGFKLPNDAPLPLKKACALIVQQDRIQNQTASVAGMRQISHKEARVAFYDPNALLMKSIGAKSPAMQAAESLIRPYLRIEV
jgi:hypothetical protein